MLWQVKAKELTGQDIDIDVADIDTDVNVDLDLNGLARTDGIVSSSILYCDKPYKQHTS